MASGETVKLKLFDTYSKKKQDFVPLDKNNVRLYACGPTVYDYAHIGNARPAIVFDVLFRLLRHVYGEDHVTYVRNITDVDDKINARAARDYPDLPLNEAIRKVTETTHNQYQKDVTALGCLVPDHQPRATETIPEMVAMIEVLVAKKHAYVSEGHVLFNVKSWKSGGELEYGKLSHRDLDEMIAGARVEVASYKRDPMDFVLWKPSSDEEPGWTSPWGRGRPGWHIECSAMAKKFLGDEFDIHGGGIDLSFPHHENELAQSCCANNTDRMAQIWMHNGFLQVEGKKMSKSDGNFITINELLETEKFGGRKWPGEVLRLAMLMTHYREPIDFSVARLEEAAAALAQFATFADKDAEEEPTFEFKEALADDLNSPKAMAILHAQLKQARGGWSAIADRAADPNRTYEGIENSPAAALAANLRLLGIELRTFDKGWLQKSIDKTIDASRAKLITEHVAARLEALAAKDFAKADEIRNELAEQGIQLMDYKDPDTGERKTKWEVKR